MTKHVLGSFRRLAPDAWPLSLNCHVFKLHCLLTVSLNSFVMFSTIWAPVCECTRSSSASQASKIQTFSQQKQYPEW